MKLKVIGSHLCPDTLYALNRLCEADVEVDFQDILSCHSALLDYLELRENSPLYADVRGNRRIGIPCFVREDGTMTRDLNEVLG